MQKLREDLQQFGPVNGSVAAVLAVLHETAYLKTVLQLLLHFTAPAHFAARKASKSKAYLDSGFACVPIAVLEHSFGIFQTEQDWVISEPQPPCEGRP